MDFWPNDFWQIDFWQIYFWLIDLRPNDFWQNDVKTQSRRLTLIQRRVKKLLFFDHDRGVWINKNRFGWFVNRFDRLIWVRVNGFLVDGINLIERSSGEAGKRGARLRALALVMPLGLVVRLELEALEVFQFEFRIKDFVFTCQDPSFRISIIRVSAVPAFPVPLVDGEVRAGDRVPGRRIGGQRGCLAQKVAVRVHFARVFQVAVERN